MAGNLEDILGYVTAPTDDDAATRARALAGQLRGQQDVGGLLTMAAGSQAIPALGASMRQGAQSTGDRLIQAAGVREQGLLRRALGLDVAGVRGQTARDVANIKATSAETVGAGHDAARKIAAGMMFNQRLGMQDRIIGPRLLLQLGKDVSPESNPGLKPYRDLMFQADRLNALATDPQGTVKDLDPSQMEEMALGLHRIFTGANRTVQSQVSALVPQTAIGDANKFKRWFMNEPTGTGQVQFVQMMHDTINRERQVAQTRLSAAQKEAVARNIMAVQRYPNEAMSVLQASGIDPEDILGGVGNNAVPNLGTYNPPGGLPKPGGEVPMAPNAPNAPNAPGAPSGPASNAAARAAVLKKYGL